MSPNRLRRHRVNDGPVERARLRRRVATGTGGARLLWLRRRRRHVEGMLFETACTAAPRPWCTRRRFNAGVTAWPVAAPRLSRRSARRCVLRVRRVDETGWHAGPRTDGAEDAAAAAEWWCAPLTDSSLVEHDNKS